jgi:sRNA-binding carbon storage regulator CsrA
VLALTLKADRGRLTDSNCLVLDLADGSRVRVWLVEKENGKVRVVVDAPRSVTIRRGTLLGAAACTPEEQSK